MAPFNNLLQSQKNLQNSSSITCFARPCHHNILWLFHDVCIKVFLMERMIFKLTQLKTPCRRRSRMPTWLRNGRSKVTKTFVVFAASRWGFLTRKMSRYWSSSCQYIDSLLFNSLPINICWWPPCRRETPTSPQTASAECQRTSWRKAESLSVFIVAVEDVPDDLHKECVSHYLHFLRPIVVFFYLLWCLVISQNPRIC